MLIFTLYLIATGICLFLIAGASIASAGNGLRDGDRP